MLYLFIPIAYLLILAALLSYLCRRMLYDTIPFAMLLSVTVMYGAYIARCLHLAIPLLLALACVLFAACVLRRVKNKSEKLRLSDLKNNIPTLFCFLAALAFYLYMSRDQYVTYWDELRLWGAYPKCLYYDQGLQMGADSYLFAIMQSYPPAVPLFAWFVSAFAPEYIESSVFLAYSLFGLCLLIRLTSGLRVSNKWEWLAVAGLIILAPALVFYFLVDDLAYYYGSLFVDPMLGVAFGYTLYSASNGKRGKAFDTVLVFLSCVVLSQVKDSGAFLALCCMLLWAVTYMAGSRGAMPRKAAVSAAGLIVLALSYVSWQSVLKAYGVTNHIEFSMDHAGKLLYEILRTVKELLLFPTIKYESWPVVIQLPGFVLLAAMVALPVIALRRKAQDAPALLAGSIAYGVASVGFIAGYCVCFFGAVVKRSYPSLHRYAGTLFLAYAVFALMSLVPYMRPRDAAPQDGLPRWRQAIRARMGRISPAVCVLICAFVLAAPSLKHANWMMDTLNEAADRAQTILTVSAAEAQERRDCYFLTCGNQTDMSQLHHRVYYDLIGTPMRIANYYAESNPMEMWPEDDRPSTLTNFLTDRDFAYLYVNDLSEPFILRYGSLFPGGAPQTDTLYRCSPDGFTPARVSRVYNTVFS